MSDDIFSQLFNLFNNDDGDVNWNLASQINSHINKDAEENFLFSNSEMNYDEIFRAIQPVSYTHLTLPTSSRV